jgi:hypothetical protein
MKNIDDSDLPTPEGHLHAFMDGELDIQSEQPLFDELAANPELRSEMRDALSIRAAVHRDVIAPPPSTEAALLAAAGLASVPAGAAGAAGAAGVVAASTASSLALGIRFALGGLLVGAAIVYFLMLGLPQGDTTDVALQPLRDQPVGVAGPPPVDTVRVIVPVAAPSMADAQRRQLAREAQRLAQEWLALNDARSAFEQERLAASRIDDDAALSNIASTTAPVGLLLMQAPSAQSTLATAFVTKPYTLAEPLPLQIRFRTLASGLRSDEPVPASVQSAALPNTALSITLPLTEEHRIGVEFGREAFRQQFQSTLSGRPVEYLQVPTLFWFGANYQFVAQSILGLDGLRPYAESTLGYAFEQGPLVRAAAGLQYRPIGPIAFMLGFDASFLAFQHDGRSHSSTKTGMTTGIAIDLGSWP